MEGLQLLFLIVLLCLNRYPQQNRPNASRIMVAPEGRFSRNESITPPTTASRETRTDRTTVILKPRATCKAVDAGSISSADINITPTSFMASTTVRAVRAASRPFRKRILMPLVDPE